jgi:hypothetical protein
LRQVISVSYGCKIVSAKLDFFSQSITHF